MKDDYREKFAEFFFEKVERGVFYFDEIFTLSPHFF
jgi:hypothetical protein